jgi:tetratricopeptide (TPR) repeat protein
MNPTHDRGPSRAALRRRAVGVLGLVLLLVAVAACGSKSPAQRAQDELNAGLAADAAGKVDEAATHYKACLTFEPLNKYCIFNLGVQAQNAKRALEAENDYRLALLQDPDFPSALYNLAILRRQAGSTDEAIALYRHLLEVDPNNASGHFNLGLALVATGDVEGGKKEIAEGVRLNPALVVPSSLPVPSGSPAPTPTATPAPTPVRSTQPSPRPS